MNRNSNKEMNPLQNLYEDVSKLLDLIEFKNQKLADDYETEESKVLGQMWVNAVDRRDSYITYKNWWDIRMFKEVDSRVTPGIYKFYYNNPYAIPLMFQEHLLESSRKAFMISYSELNTYYRMVNGLPEYGVSDPIYMSRELEKELIGGEHVPVYDLELGVQNKWMNTDEYQTVLAANPDKPYLKYLGSKKIDIYTARTAKDFEIIRYPYSNPNINPNLLNIFAKLYSDYREYVMVVLYNEKMEDVYLGYRTFCGILIIAFVLMQLGNKAVELSISNNFVDDTSLYTMLDLYNIDSNLVLSKDTRRKLVRALPRLTKAKGTDEIYSDLANILGYTDTVIRKLLLVHEPNYNEKYKDRGENTNTYFMGIKLGDEDPYQSIVSDVVTKYPYRNVVDDTDGKIKEYGIAEGDSYWWVDDETVMNLIENGKERIMNSKYITIESSIKESEAIFELIYFCRMILDNKEVTKNIMFEVPEIFTKPISLFDTVLMIISALVKISSNGELVGKMQNNEDLFAIAGFNFDIDKASLNTVLNKMKYVEVNKLNSYLQDITINNVDDISRVYETVIYPLRIWLENKISRSENREEFLEYESIYKALYTYDIRKTSWLDDYRTPVEIILKKYGLKQSDYDSLLAYYSYNTESSVYKLTDDIEILDKIGPFNITFDSRALDSRFDTCTISFYDILNSPDFTDLKVTLNDDEISIFKTDGNTNSEIFQKIIEMIEGMDDNSLNNAVYLTNATINSTKYLEGNLLPDLVRSEGLIKKILIDKINLDASGKAVNAETFEQLLEGRTGSDGTLWNLYNELDPNDINFDRWKNKLLNVFTTMENLVGLKLSYIEQILFGTDQYFKPLVELIKHFKSIYVDIAKTSIKNISAAKMDTGGNSNMFKLFDDSDTTIYVTTVNNSMYNAEFGLYDMISKATYYWELNDIGSFIKYSDGEGFAAEERNEYMGSIRMSDEARFFLNGVDLDPTDGTYQQHGSLWRTGEANSGRWTADDDFLMQSRKSTQRIKTGVKLDLDGWKEYR